jgi:hypothetical protein
MDITSSQSFLDSSTLKIHPNGSIFINGMSNSFPTDYPSYLINFLDENTFKSIIVEINKILEIYWPCKPIYFFSYFCCLCSLGSSFLLSKVCVDDAEKAVKQYLQELNQGEMKEKGLEIILKRENRECWLEIRTNEKNIAKMSCETAYSSESAKLT